MAIKNVHHIAYRCNDAKETVDFYTQVVGMEFVMAMAEDRVPSTKEPDPYMHIFFDAGAGSVLAFFDLPNSPPKGRDPNTPDWVQHIALEVEGPEELEAVRQRVAATGRDVVGPTDHTIFTSIYFYDPSGNRIEVTYRSAVPGAMAKLREAAYPMLEEWTRTKKPPKQAAWVHGKEFA